MRDSSEVFVVSAVGWCWREMSRGVKAHRKRQLSAWEAVILPLNYARKLFNTKELVLVSRSFEIFGVLLGVLNKINRTWGQWGKQEFLAKKACGAHHPARGCWIDPVTSDQGSKMVPMSGGGMSGISIPVPRHQ